MDGTTVNAPYETTGFDAPILADNADNGIDNQTGNGPVQNPETAGNVQSGIQQDVSTDVGQQPDTDKQAEHDPLARAENATREEATKALTDVGLDFGKFEREYLANGELSPESYAELEKAGVGKNYVDAYIRGNEAILQRFIDDIHGMAGGTEQYNAMTKWAETNLPKEEAQAYNEIMASGNQAMIRIAVSGLIARHNASEGAEPAIVKGGTPASGKSASGFASAAEMTAAMRDPRYGKDDAYTRDVERKTGNSNFFW